MIPDCVELDEFKTSNRREGLYYATATLIQKAATAAAMGLAGLLLGIIGYSDASQMTPEIANGIKWLFALGSSIPLVMSATIVLFTPMNRIRHASLREAIALRRQGKAYSIDGFRELFNNEIEASKYC